MNAILRTALAATGLAIATQAAANVTFYEREGFDGRAFSTEQQMENFELSGFYDRAASAVVIGERWEVCENAHFGGRCAVLRPGRYPSVAAMGLSNRASSVRAVGRNVRIDDNQYAPAPVAASDRDAAAQVYFYESENFQGRHFSTDKQIGDFNRLGFNDRAASVIVVGERWQVCEGASFSGRCVVLGPGRYASPAAIGLTGRIASVRDVSGNARIEDYRYAPAPAAGSGRDAAAQVYFYENEGFQGRYFSTDKQIGDFERFGFNNRAASIIVVGEQWQVCEGASFSGRCVVLGPGRYASPAAIGLTGRIASVRDVSGSARTEDYRYAPAPAAGSGRDAAAQVYFYEGENFQGRSFATEKRIGDFKRFGFNDRAASVIVVGQRWEVCENVRFGGRCVVLRPGRYASLAAMGLNDRIASVREVRRNARIEDYRYAPVPPTAIGNYGGRNQ